MIRHLFIYLSVVLTLLCFITSCKKDSQAEDVNSEKSISKNNASKQKQENLVIRDDKTTEEELVTEIKETEDSESIETQETTTENSQDVQQKSNSAVYDVAEQLPEYPGGVSALNKYISEKTKDITSVSSLSKSVRTMVSFIVETDGSISSPSVARSSGNKTLDDEAVRIILHMPAWEPAKNKGENVRMKYLVPVIFNPVQ